MNPLEFPSNVARSDELDLSKVPDVVKKAAEKASPGSRWESASSETTYELEGKDAKGRNVIVEVSEDGDVEDVSTELAIKDVPAVVTSALKAKMPRFKIETVFE